MGNKENLLKIKKKEYDKEYHKKNKTIRNKMAREWYYNNQERVKDYRLKNKERINDFRRKYYQKNKHKRNKELHRGKK